MTPDLNLPPITANAVKTAPSSPAAAASAMALELLRPIAAATLAPGESARAEVVSNKAQTGQFEILLRLAKAGIPPTEVSVTSRQAIDPGTSLTVQAVGSSRLMAILDSVAGKASGPQVVTRLDPQLFPQGSVLQARIISNQALPAGSDQARFAVLAKVLQGPAAGALLSLDSTRPAAPGSLLTAQVSGQGELRVTSANEQIRQLDLLQGMRATLQTQASAEPMLRMLDKVAALPDLPPLLQTVMRQVLTHIATPEHLSTTSGVAQAVRQSGVFLEAGLDQLNRALQTGNTARSAQPASDQPSQTLLPPLARLLPLLSSLATPPGTEPLPGADFKASLLTLLITLQQQLPPDASKALTFPPGPWQAALTAKPGLFPLPARALQTLTDSPDLGSLLRLTAALLSRIQHHQFQSLGQTQAFADGSTQTVWQLEIPLRDGQQFTQIQMRIQRDSNAPDGRQTEQAPQWEIRLAFNLDQLGPLQAIARLYKGRVSSEFWAEQADTLQRLNNEMDRLRDRLLTKGLDVGELSCHRGSPPEPRQAVQQRWIDEVT
ncbi:hook-length control protein FliK [Halopseudomonas litoralis]|uniref:Hook-length control protein FliK n=1 Tax=Halopseudomonas litoralis TaxID=797277 RepID=A0A1H1NG75_9GAMM|nr:flagellar hook-length control protein FliK [Halopseudomonas litoralis]SDR97937.1 hook-length control protein FliK [Halopseudomonas litoralis]